jgi:hypothetical protein
LVLAYPLQTPKRAKRPRDLFLLDRCLLDTIHPLQKAPELPNSDLPRPRSGPLEKSVEKSTTLSAPLAMLQSAVFAGLFSMPEEGLEPPTRGL